MNAYQSGVHKIDTRQSTSLTVFDGTREDESKLAKQFWNSLALIPPVESTLVCTEINQRIRSRTINDGKPKSRFSTTKTKIKEEKSIKNKILEEAIAIHQEKEEERRIKAIEQRNQQVRQLFRKQAIANRLKNDQLIIPQLLNYATNTDHQPSTFLLQDEINEKIREDENDRQLVCLLPD